MIRPWRFLACAALLVPAIGYAQTPVRDLPSDRDAWPRLTGVYAVRAAPGAAAVRLRVFERGDTLWGQMGENAPTRLMDQGGGEFRPSAAPEFSITFVPVGGRAEKVAIRSPEGTMSGERSSEAARDPETSGPLFDELARMDSLLFDATYVACDPARIDALLDRDVEFYHDRYGLHAGDQVRADFAELVASCPATHGVTREIVPGTLRVHPLGDFGAVQTGVHRFVERGASTVTEAQFVHLWRKTGGKWTLSRVLSFEHRAISP